MEKADLLKHSPVRYFENATQASLKEGEMSLITAKKGIGKTSVLVQFGLDSLLANKNLVHVSFDQESSNVISWYSSILSEIAKKINVNVSELSEEIMKNRTILNFNQETFTLPKVVHTLKSLKDGGILINTIVVDGLNLSKTEKADLDCFAEFIKSEKMNAYFSYTCESDKLKDTLPEDKLAVFATVAHLASNGKNIELTVLKNGEGKLPLNSKTLLMSK